MTTLSHKKGFTLVEIMVALSVFTVIMVISMGSILSVVDANRKSQSLRAVMDNMNSTFETMTRTIRFGKNYHCASGGSLGVPQNCTAGTTLTVTDSSNAQVTFSLDGTTHRIVRTVGGTGTYITSPDVTITTLSFWVDGSAPYVNLAGACPGSNDCYQPRVIMVVSGFAGTKSTIQSTFTLETTVSQRLFDFQ